MLNRVEFKNLAGINKAINPSDLPKNTWSGGNNIRFRDGKTYKAIGHEEVFSSAPDGVLYLHPIFRSGTPYWLLGTSTKIWRTEGGPPVDLSRTVGGAYTASEDEPWIGGTLNQVVVFNNGVDVPQAFLPSSVTFENLANWPADTLARVIRPFKNYLIALNTTYLGVNQPHTVKWSSPADPGQVPATWDVTDPTNDAGENFLADTDGPIVDGRKLRDSFIIYKTDSVYSMRYVGGVFVFQFQQLFDDVGMLAPNCVAEFEGKHFVVTQGDVYVHNGVQKNSVIDGQMKDYLFSTMNPQATQRVFVVPDYANTEMWICYPTTNSDTNKCNRALIWNWKSNEWTIRDLPDVFYGTYGVVDPQVPDYWDIDTDPWNIDTTVWGDSTFNPAKTKILFTSVTNNKIYLLGETSLFDQSVFTSFVEKADIYLNDDLKMKVISAITPYATGSGTLQIYVGRSTIMGGPIEWFGPYQYTIGTQFKVDCRVVGRHAAVKFEAESSGNWSINGFSIEFAPTAGER